MLDERLEELMRPHLPFLPTGERLTSDSDLRDFGLDSMAIVELLATLERTYGVRFKDELLNLETFATPGTLWRALTGLGATA